MKRMFLWCALGMLLTPPSAWAATATRSLSTSIKDRTAIEVLLKTYTKAVSTKNQALFETLLLNKSIPFSYIPDDTASVSDIKISNYEGFRKGVFEGRPFTQKFKHVIITQDKNLADVRLIFINTETGSSSWGWKTIQLLKVAGVWKIASEFYTGH